MEYCIIGVTIKYTLRVLFMHTYHILQHKTYLHVCNTFIMVLQFFWLLAVLSQYSNFLKNILYFYVIKKIFFTGRSIRKNNRNIITSIHFLFFIYMQVKLFNLKKHFNFNYTMHFFDLTSKLFLCSF